MSTYSNTSSWNRTGIRLALRGALNLRPQERRPITLLWLHSFFLGVGAAYLLSAALSIFLSAFSIAYLPGVFAATAALEFLVARGSDALEERIGLSRILRLISIFLAVGTFAFWFLLRNPFVSATGASLMDLTIVFCLLIWSRILVFVSDDTFWMLPLRVFDVRQGKRLFSLIDSGSFFANILGYFSVPLLIHFIQVTDLLIFSGLGTAASIWALQRILAHYAPILSHAHTHRHAAQGGNMAKSKNHPHESSGGRPHASAPSRHSKIEKSALAFLWRHNYLASIAGVTFFAGLANTLVDYGFLRGIELRAMNMAQIASFLGFFLGAAQLVSLLLKLGIVGRLFGRFGLAKTSIVLPIALVLTTGAGLIISTSQPATAMIWSFTISMLLVQLWSDAVQMPALAISFQPLIPSERHRGRQTIGSVIEPLALAAAGGLLYFLSIMIGFTFEGISLVMLIVFAGWGVAILLFDREYKTMIIHTLKHRRLDPAELEWDEDTRTIIAEKLKSPHTTEASYALQLIPTTEAGFFVDALPDLLNRGEERVRHLALERLGEFDLSPQKRKQATDILETAIEREPTNSSAFSQLLYDLAFVGDEFDRQEWERWLYSNQLSVREGLLSGLIKFKGTEGILFAGTYLQALENSSEPQERITAANIVERVGMAEFYTPLLPLLNDTAPEVRLAAIRASAKVCHPRLIEPLLDLYVQPSTSQHTLSLIEASLQPFRNIALSTLVQRIQEGRFDGNRLQRLTRLIGHWRQEGDSEGNADPELVSHSIQILLELLNWPPTKFPTVAPRFSTGSLRLASLRELVGATIEGENQERLRKIIDEELLDAQTLMVLISTSDDESPTPGASPDIISTTDKLLQSALAYELRLTSERILLLLSLSFEREVVFGVRDSLLLGDDRYRGNAFEALEHLLPAALAKQVVSLLEFVHHLNKRNTREHNHLPPVGNAPLEAPRIGVTGNATLSDDAARKWLILDSKNRLEPWTVATAIYWAGIHAPERYIGAIQHAAEQPGIPGLTAKMILQSKIGQSYTSTRSGFVTKSPPAISYHYSLERESMSLLFERVMLLKTVELFRETPDPVLAHIAQALEEIHAESGEQIITKGESGTCLYIIVAGSVRVHDGDVQLSILSSRDVVGELALLDPEPRSASITAIEETTLLRLDHEVFFDLMFDNIEIARGAIATLCRRIRNQNARTARADIDSTTIRPSSPHIGGHS